MTGLPLTGRARRFGDGINTDTILASRRKRDSLDPQVLRQYLFEELDPGLAATFAPGDMIVAGRNFGCGSAMEVAVTVLRGAGIAAVVAASFARTYYRNAINNGLPAIACDTTGIAEGDRVRLAAEGETIWVENLTRGGHRAAEPVPAILREILAAGGLVPYIKRHSGFPSQV